MCVQFALRELLLAWWQCHWVSVTGRWQCHCVSLVGDSVTVCHWSLTVSLYVTGRSQCHCMSLVGDSVTVCHWSVTVSLYVTGHRHCFWNPSCLYWFFIDSFAVCHDPTKICLNSSLHLLTPWCRVLLEQLTGLQLVKKFPAFHGTRMFITALTSVRHLSLSWASPI